MAESLVLAVVRGVVGKAADALVQGVTRMWGIDDDRLKLERHLVYVQSFWPTPRPRARPTTPSGRG